MHVFWVIVIGIFYLFIFSVCVYYKDLIHRLCMSRLTIPAYEVAVLSLVKKGTNYYIK